MRVTDERVVTIGYEVLDEDGALIDATDEDQSFAYVHGIGQMVPGFEAALEGAEPGDRLDFEVPAEAAYGPADERLVLLAPRARLVGVCEPAVGVAVLVRVADQVRVARIVQILDQNVLLDANPPLAGKDLRFRVEVRAVREACEDELRLRRVRSFSGSVV